MAYRKDNIDRERISAVIDKRLKESIKGNTSDTIERALKMYLDEESTDEDQAYRLKEEREDKLQRLYQLKDEIKEIEEKAKRRFGTSLDDYIENNLIANTRKERNIIDFLEKILQNKGTRERWNNGADLEREARFIWDTLLKRRYGLQGEEAELFVKDAYSYYTNNKKLINERVVDEG